MSHELIYKPPRDGRTGVVVKQTYPLPNVAPHQAPCRIHRGRLQKALLKNVDQRRVQPGKKLVKVERVDSGRLRLVFSCGSLDEVDLIIGADGIRSVSGKLLNKESKALP
jgi:2-polyprenyl-6-methoxyphenol hydroxylase and related FAD-dependent oxidoreductases